MYLDNFALIITPDSYLSQRTIITVVFENNTTDGEASVYDKSTGIAS